MGPDARVNIPALPVDATPLRTKVRTTAALGRLKPCPEIFQPNYFVLVRVRRTDLRENDKSRRRPRHFPHPSVL